jgi:hypothetical protein
LGDALPLISVSSSRAAQQVLDACQRGDAELYITNWLNPAVIAAQLAPALTTEILSLIDRFVLPGPGGIGKNARRGYESESAISPSPLTALNESAAAQNNQLRPRR